MNKAFLITLAFTVVLSAFGYPQQGKSPDENAGPAPSTMDMSEQKPPAVAPTTSQNIWPGWGRGWPNWPGFDGQNQYAYPQNGGMGCCGMGGMGGMGMGGMGMGGMPAAGPQGMGMYMGRGTTIQDLVQLVTLQDILESLLKVVAIQEKTLGKSTAAERQSILRELDEIRKKIEGLLQENRAQITGSSLD